MESGQHYLSRRGGEGGRQISQAQTGKSVPAPLWRAYERRTVFDYPPRKPSAERGRGDLEDRVQPAPGLLVSWPALPLGSGHRILHSLHWPASTGIPAAKHSRENMAMLPASA